jgi:hypothetical protein
MMEVALAFGLAGLVVSALAAAVGMWVLYYVVKSAVRDGINESSMVSRKDWGATVREAQRAGTLPDMRAER